jgi:hypothetical protein
LLFLVLVVLVEAHLLVVRVISHLLKEGQALMPQ